MRTISSRSRSILAVVAAAGTLGAAVAGVTAPAEPDRSGSPDPARPDVRAAASAVRPVAPAPLIGMTEAELATLKANEPGPVPEPQPEPAPAPAPPPAAPAQPTGSVWDRLAMCESSGNWASTVGTYEGGLQFHPSTWDAYKPSGYPGAAYEATRAQQILVAERVLAAQGWGAWPACSRKLGLR